MSRTNAVGGRSSGCSHAGNRRGKWREAPATRRIWIGQLAKRYNSEGSDGMRNQPSSAPLPSSIGGHSVTASPQTTHAEADVGSRMKQYLLRLYKGLPLDDSPFRFTNGFYSKLLAFNWWVHPGDSMQVGKRNPLGTVAFTGIDFAAHRQTRVVALL